MNKLSNSESSREKYMRRAMELAEGGRGYANPNPLVGAVIVKDGEIIGEGFHETCGEAHAEINAFRDAEKKGNDVKGADMYVTLEPCSHHGKTPPCAEAIIEKGIGRVFVGIEDPNPLVGGNGIKMLKDAGIEVESGFLEEELKKQNEIFLHYITEKKPFCVMKTAMSLDGKIATYTGDSKWISNEKSRQYVHRLRHCVMGIMVGVNTVIQDDPMLTTRLSEDVFGRAPSDTVKIVVDSLGRIPIDSNLVQNIEKTEKGLIVASTDGMDSEKEKELTEKGATVLKIESDNRGRVNLEKLMEKLAEMKIDSVLLEGGGSLNFSALESGVVDKVESFIAPKIIGGRNAITPVEGEGVSLVRNAFELHDTEIEEFDGDIMIRGYLGKGV